MNKSTTCIFGLAFLVLSACTSDLNLKPDTTFSYGGNWAAPIVHARLNLADLVNDSTIVADNEGLIHILYSNDSIYAFDAKEFTKVPDRSSKPPSSKVRM